ncbi:hypothetical protein SPD48_01515 [Pseudogracilibacillus sp. SE30717A]|uniref:hypothetical protein n=1 Tax=Pseudogracilibacillus sp. SE30717A TaxID=3098293 RepID=UPI00300E31AE
MKKGKKVILVLIFILLLFACENHFEIGEKKVTYQNEFPKESSPALSEFLRSYILGYESILLFKGEAFIYSDRNMNTNSNKLTYFQHTSSQLNEYYDPIFSTDHPEKILHELFDEKKGRLHHEIEDEENKFLPDVTLDKGNVLKIKTDQKNVSFSIPENLDKNLSDELILNIESTNEFGFILQLENDISGEIYYFFALNDLSEMDIFQDIELTSVIEQGQLKPYYPLLKTINESLSVIDYKIIDTKTHEVFKVESEHSFSKDYKYIYLNGRDNPLEEGVQRVQRIEDYVEGNDQYYAEFKLNYEEISDELDFNSVGIGSANTVYFNEDLIVIHLEFDAAITGTAGSTNVIIDLQKNKDNPIFYLVDLGIIA